MKVTHRQKRAGTSAKPHEPRNIYRHLTGWTNGLDYCDYPERDNCRYCDRSIDPELFDPGCKNLFYGRGKDGPDDEEKTGNDNIPTRPKISAQSEESRISEELSAERINHPQNGDF